MFAPKVVAAIVGLSLLFTFAMIANSHRRIALGGQTSSHLEREIYKTERAFR